MNPSSSSFKRKKITNYCDDVTEPNCKRMKDDAHDVFVNFSEDTANGFAAHLRGALRRHGFTLFDHTMLPSGHDVGPELLKAIKKSGIYVVVFSVKYALFERCLDELVNVMRCFHKSQQRKVLPVFYNVEPSDVRKQVGSYEEAFAAYQTDFDPERVQQWRQALRDAGELSGYHLQNGDEAEFVKKIVEQLENMQNPQELYVAGHCLVGMRSRVERLISYLRLDLEDVLIVAVLGISGIGKTTIAKATYNRIASNFEASCFLGDIQDRCGRWSGKVDLQNVLISSLSQQDKPIQHHHNDGVSKIRKLIGRRKVLLVLDDVDKFEQLQMLLINRKYFHQGSRIIVTTRDESSLGNLPYTSYNTSLLDHNESVELSTRLTFEQDEVEDEVIDKNVISEIVRCAAGLPLVLEILSIHFRRLGRKQWPSELKKLKRIPLDDVQKKLEISYDPLTDVQKKLFLDIACFFVGRPKHVIIKVLEDEESGFFPDVELQKLVEKGLVTTYHDRFRERVKMHDAIRDMGREIVRRENVDDPGQRTRLIDQDVVRVLRECSGTESVESIRLDTYLYEEKVSIQVEAIRKMSNLRLIRLGSHAWSCSDDDMPPLSFKKLTYLEWEGFPFKSLDILDMPNVVVVKLRDSKLERLWEGRKSLKKLRVLEVCYSSFNLTGAANISGLENLEELRFHYCGNLKELSWTCCNDEMPPLSFKKLRCLEWDLFPFKSLDILDMPNVEVVKLWHSELERLWEGRKSLKKLRVLDVSYSSSLTRAPNFSGLENLEELRFAGCQNLEELDNSLGCLDKLVKLNLCECKRLSRFPFEEIGKLRSLKKLYLTGCCNIGLECDDVIDRFFLLFERMSYNSVSATFSIQ